MDDYILSSIRCVTGEIEKLFHEHGADRIVFLRDNEKATSLGGRDEFTDLLVNFRPQKYKLQVADGAGWRDLTAYSTVHGADSALSQLRKGSPRNFKEMERRRLCVSSYVAREQFVQALRGFHRSAFDRLVRSLDAQQLNHFIEVIDDLKEVEAVSEECKFVFELVRLYSRTLQTGIWSKFLAPEGVVHIRDVDAALADVTVHEYERSYFLAFCLVAGKLYSVADRDVAARYFRKVRQQDSEMLVELFYLDVGAYSYFSSREVALGSRVFPSDIINSIVPADQITSDSRMAILIAMDIRFFRIYAPMLLFQAQQLPEYDFNFVVVGDISEFEEAVSDVNNFCTSLARLNRSGLVSNVRYFNASIPEHVGSKVTFYSCLRFFAVELIWSYYDNIYIMDADLMIDSDPRGFFNSIVKLDFAAPIMMDFNFFSPWRRVMAGNISIRTEPSARTVISDIQDYICAGLEMTSNWTLDQNALSYGLERNPAVVSDLGPFKRPFRQPKFRLSWERRFGKL